LNAALAKLNNEYKAANDEKTAAVNEANRCASRLNLATRLVNALGSEKERWGNSITSLEEQMALVAGDVLIAASFVSYAGPFNKKFRVKMIDNAFLNFMKEKAIP